MEDKTNTTSSSPSSFLISSPRSVASTTTTTMVDQYCPCRQRLFTFCNDCHTSAISSISHIHKMIRDEDFDSVRDCIMIDVDEERHEKTDQDMPSTKTTTRQSSRSRSDSTCSSSSSSSSSSCSMMILWESNTRGWTAMHYASSFHMCCDLSWWKWVLHQSIQEILIRNYYHEQHSSSTSTSSSSSVAATTSSSSSSLVSYYFQYATNDMGQTCIDLFFRHALYPLSWQKSNIHERAKQLRAALHWITTSTDTTSSKTTTDAKRQQEAICLLRQELCGSYSSDDVCGSSDSFDYDNDDVLLPEEDEGDHDIVDIMDDEGYDFTQDENQMIISICQFWKRFIVFLDTLYSNHEIELDEFDSTHMEEADSSIPLQQNERQQKHSMLRPSSCHHNFLHYHDRNRKNPKRCKRNSSTRNRSGSFTSGSTTTPRRDVLLCQLSSLGWCPYYVAKLAMLLYPPLASRAPIPQANAKLRQVPTSPQSPLQVFVSTPSTHRTFKSMENLGRLNRDDDFDNKAPSDLIDDYDSDPGILPLLLQLDKDSVKIRDYQTGRLPFHVALTSLLRSSMSWDFPSTIRAIFDAYPQALHEVDPVTHYPSFILSSLVATMNPPSNDQVELLAKQLLSSSSSSSTSTTSSCSAGAWMYLPRKLKQHVLKESKEKLVCQQLDVTFQLLRQNPDAIRRMESLCIR